LQERGRLGEASRPNWRSSHCLAWGNIKYFVEEKRGGEDSPNKEAYVILEGGPIVCMLSGIRSSISLPGKRERCRTTREGKKRAVAFHEDDRAFEKLTPGRRLARLPIETASSLLAGG